MDTAGIDCLVMYETMLAGVRFCFKKPPSFDLRVGLPLAGVGRRVFILSLAEDLESWVTLNTLVLAQLCLLCAVDLCESNVLLLKGSRSLLVLRSEGLAVTAPRGKNYMFG